MIVRMTLAITLTDPNGHAITDEVGVLFGSDIAKCTQMSDLADEERDLIAHMVRDHITNLIERDDEDEEADDE